MEFTETKDVGIEKPQSESIYELIINKIEKPDNLSKKFDYSKNYTEKELSGLNLDSTKIGANEYYFLTDQKFLSEDLDGMDFKIYYRFLYGALSQKVLRVGRQDSILNKVLSANGGDGQNVYEISTEFINDSIFLETLKRNETVKDNTHSMAHAIDSIVTTYSYNSKLDLQELQKDTFHIYKEFPIYHKKLQNQSFNVWSHPFKINNITCRWEYEVKYTEATNEKSAKVLVNLLGQKLINLKSKKTILELDLSRFMFIYNPIDISVLDNNNFKNQITGDFITYPAFYSYSNNDLEDVNQDGFGDFKFTVENAGGGANMGYETYLFDSTDQSFSHSEIFSGYNIEYDPIKNRISNFGKGSVIDYYYLFINLKQNRKDIAFTEKVRHYGDTIFYEKLIDGKLIEEKRIVLDEFENFENYLERK